MNILGIAGWKNSGKTTLVRSLITELTNRNIRVSTLKHAHHDFDIDQPGTDSYKHRKAGAQEVLIVSSRRWALIHEETEVSKPDLTTMLGKLEDTDLVLVEGFKSLSFPKLEIRREDSSGPDLAPNDKDIIAIVSDRPVPEQNMPAFDLDDIKGIAEFVMKIFDLR
ncbi:MAG: molybdopterin-guanine dinucleotide biosynthesis protein B [Rhodobacteraceae bacterium]|nr:molybdopterin-guanine dinucleotide biosynthesis protein B [Paracoccaceae bacterium]MDE2917064.1 molybdopterin-guanine dinucleotide biosynthesis protein B [Paracoccaceae bacterium]MYE37755.1 molybdopterin-guanine dinucleotide biosynthesis protein B [Paracoccaceae bacterium]MYG42598.1 molybdopterin-guanine dinucleotide biosynthesis protein B [Paracoccaceae bacterium]